MNEVRSTNLKKFKEQKPQVDEVKIKKEAKKRALFIDAFQREVAEFKEITEGGFNINDIDNILEQLSELKTIGEKVTELKDTIGSIAFPEYADTVKIDGLEELTKRLQDYREKEVKIEWLNEEKLKTLTDAMGEIKTAVGEALIAPEPDQRAGAFTPMRRVRKIANRFYFDDAQWGSSGGGGSPQKTIYHAVIDQSGAGTDALVAATTGKIRVTSYAVVLGGAGTVKFQSASTDITGAMSFAANGGISIANSDQPVMETAANAALNIVTTGAAGKGHLSYFIE